MTLLTDQSYLSANLAALGKRNGDLIAVLEDVATGCSITFAPSADDVPAVELNGRQLCSLRHPLAEADRLIQDVDLLNHAVVVVLGFGAGYHVRKLAERSAKSTLIIVFEPDLALLRAVLEHVDHTRWLRESLIVFITDPCDRGVMAKKLQGAESILAQGVEFVHHPASGARLGGSVSQFIQTFNDHVAAAKTTLTTTLMRSVETVRNLILNIDH